MKKLLALALAMLVVLSMVACGSDAETTAPATETDAPATDTNAPESDAPATDTQAPETETDTQAPETEAPAPEPEPAGYTKGTIADGVYANAWMGITYTIGDGWIDNTEAGSATVAGSSTEMGLYIQNTQNGSVLQIMFEKLPALQAAMTEQEYSEALKPVLEATYAQQGVTFGGFTTSTATLAGQSYFVLTSTIANPAVAQVMYLRNVDGYMATLCASATSVEDAIAVLNSITEFNETDTQAPETANDKAGTVANGVYTNTWAKLTYTIPANLMDMTAMMGASYDGVNEIVGLCAVDMNAGSMIQILFEKIGYDPEAPTTAKGGIEQLIAECNTNVEEGTTVTASDIVELEIQGITYWGADFVTTSADASAYTSVLVAEHDGYFIMISL